MKSRKIYTPSGHLSRLTEEGIARELNRGSEKLTLGERSALTVYLKTLLHWNTKFNLVGPTDWKEVCRTLLVDSLRLRDFLPELPLPPSPLSLDIGAGAGLPGIPLRIVWTEGHYTLVEPQQKKVTFLMYVLSRLQLQNTTILPTTIEKAGEMGPSADLILSRAFCPWKQFLKLAGPLIAPDGILLVFSNRNWSEDPACPQGWAMFRQKKYALATGHTRFFWAFKRSQSLDSG